MCHPKLPAFFLALSLVLRCVTAAPNNWYSVSSSELTDPRPEGWISPGFSTNPFLKLDNPLPQEGLTAVNRHHIQKRRCNTATCVTQRLADFLIRSSNTIGTVYAPTNVGSNTYGKRELLASIGNQGL
ncbi:islet amyloid polypeptide [Brienomyrus brachyistius]|uniref:islet amyloid polypeptide n=1 Tax=Brienomyrus brachyistius TaxID=42636 RepID=UPI0020B461D3|nr:islet amyloid polypeptide [Brienomyrus brachyistius]XP_048886220.1 islet amyloid polypeptide [Brienomyrus brachyistius]